MPEPLHPPYGILQPRTLVRWLDINSQNGPLTRSRYFFTVPAYNIAFANTELLTANTNWGTITGADGYCNAQLNSTIPIGSGFMYVPGNSNVLVTQIEAEGGPLASATIFNANIKNGVSVDTAFYYNTHSTNQFWLLGLPSVQNTIVTANVYIIQPRIIGAFDYYCVDVNNVPHSFSILGFSTDNIFNGTVTISYTNPDYSVVRYKLFDDPNNPIYGDFPMYSNEKIKPYFRIEIWASGKTANIVGGPLNLYTSKYTNIDYRYNSDTLLTTPTIKTAFATPNMNLPYVFGSPPTINTI